MAKHRVVSGWMDVVVPVRQSSILQRIWVKPGSGGGVASQLTITPPDMSTYCDLHTEYRYLLVLKGLDH
jgi:hypothetical protein